jgi:CelD/BcsL family acetyltransferase involved in cellulose biosynthesis
MHRFADRGWCRIDVVRHDGRPIAAAFQLVMDQTIYGLKIGFDESYAQIAPGNLLHWYIFRTACEDPQLETYDMTSHAAWHSNWRPRAAELLDIVVIRPGFAGRIASAEQHVLEHARDWRREVARRWVVTARGRRRLAWPRRHS